jgi:hypothetical protein
MSARDREKLIRDYIRARDGYRKAVIESRRAYEELVRRGLIPDDDKKSEQWSTRSMMTETTLLISEEPEPNWADCPMLPRGDFHGDRARPRLWMAGRWTYSGRRGRRGRIYYNGYIGPHLYLPARDTM